ncbi:MAG: hypothetical protein ACXWLR_02400 [Myxococcales bacterium]
MNKLLLAAAFLAAPLAARADIGLRLGGEADLAYNNSTGTHGITDNWPVGLDAMLSYWTPGSIVSIDLEVGEQWATKDAPSGSRLGTVLRPGIRVTPPAFPLYFRGAVPINIEQANGYSRETFDLRLGTGINIPLVLFKIYIEGDMDFPLGGGDNAPSAFSQWNLRLCAGLDFHF